MRTCVYAYIYAYIRHIYVYTRIYVHACISLYAYIRIHVYIRIHACMRIYAYIRCTSLNNYTKEDILRSRTKQD